MTNPSVRYFVLIAVTAAGLKGATAADAVKVFILAGQSNMEPTAAFSHPAEFSPNRGHSHHWLGNAESCFLVGDALGGR